MNIPTYNEIAQEIASLLRAGGRHVVTVKWPRFYELAKRERVTTPFLENVERALKAESILMVKGVTMVAFMIDYDFAPIDRQEESAAAHS
jgi:hypothetical protein